MLLQTYLFRDLSAAEVEPIARAGHLVRLARGEAAFRVGDRADGLHVVLTGQVVESVVGDDGEDVVFEVFTPGAVEGEPGIFSVERDRVVNLVAMRDSTLLRIGRDDLLAFVRDRPVVLLRLLEGLATQVRQAVEDQTALASRRVRDRVALKLLELALTHGRREGSAFTRIPLPLSQSTIAGLAGASRENVNRALGRLVDEGLVRIEGQEYLIDAVALAAAIDASPLRHRRNRRPDPSGV